MQRTRNFSLWTAQLPRAEFCNKLSIPPQEQPFLFSVSADVLGITLAFNRHVGSDWSSWERKLWSKRAFCKALGLPPHWGRALLYGVVTEDPVELRFVGKK